MLLHENQKETNKELPATSEGKYLTRLFQIELPSTSSASLPSPLSLRPRAFPREVVLPSSALAGSSPWPPQRTGKARLPQSAHRGRRGTFRAALSRASSVHAHRRNRTQLCQGPPPTKHQSLAPSWPEPATRPLSPVGKRVRWKTKQDALTQGAALAPDFSSPLRRESYPHLASPSSQLPRSRPPQRRAAYQWPAPLRAAIGGGTSEGRSFSVHTALPELCVLARATIGEHPGVGRGFSAAWCFFWA